MVKLEEVEDEDLAKAQPGPIEDSEDDDYVDTGSWLHHLQTSHPAPSSPKMQSIKT